MIYNSNNSRGAKVYDIDTKAELRRVLMVNTKTGAVVVAKQTLRLNHKGSVDRETIHFDAVHPIFGGGATPCLIHCYGRKP